MQWIETVLAAIAMLLGTYSLVSGWLIVCYDIPVLAPTDFLGLLLLRLLNGREAAKRRRAELQSSQHLKVLGATALIVGTGLLIIGFDMMSEAVLNTR